MRSRRLRRCAGDRQTVMHRMLLALTKLLAPMLVFTADEAWEHIAHKPAADAESAQRSSGAAARAVGLNVSEEQREEWKLLMELRDQALLQLRRAEKAGRPEQGLDAEVVYSRRRRRSCASSCRRTAPTWKTSSAPAIHSFAESGPRESAASVKVIDRRKITRPAPEAGSAGRMSERIRSIRTCRCAMRRRCESGCEGQSVGANPLRLIGLAWLSSMPRVSTFRGCRRAHSMQVVTPGNASRRAAAMGLPQRLHNLTAVLGSSIIKHRGTLHAIRIPHQRRRLMQRLRLLDFPCRRIANRIGQQRPKNHQIRRNRRLLNGIARIAQPNRIAEILHQLNRISGRTGHGNNPLSAYRPGPEVS